MFATAFGPIDYCQVQPGWVPHSVWFSVEHWAAVPLQSVHVQPLSLKHARAAVFVLHLGGVPAQWALAPGTQLQPGA